MPDISNDDDMRKAVDLAKSIYTPSPNETATQGRILPIKRYESGRVEFDPTAGILGGAGRAITSVGRAMKGEIPLHEINEEGEVVPSRQAIDEAMNVASQVMLSSAPSGVAQTLREGFDPNVLRTSAGATSRTANHDALAEAIRLEGLGWNRDDIWHRTGWGRNVADQWFYEIPDDLMKLRPLRISPDTGKLIPRESTLGQDVDHKLYFDAYPQLANLKLEHGFMSGKQGAYHHPSGGIAGKIEIGPEDARGVLIHELSHPVQEIENFPRGGSPQDPTLTNVATELSQRADAIIKSLQEEREDFWKSFFERYPIDTRNPIEVSNAYKYGNELWAKQNPERNAALEQAYRDVNIRGPRGSYSRLAGEIDANIAMQSRDMTPRQRREYAPWRRTAGKVPRSSQIIRFGQEEPYLPDFKLEDYIQRADGGRAGYAGKGAVQENDAVRSALDIARQMEDPANRIDAGIRGLNTFLSGLDLQANSPEFHTGLPQRPQIGGAGLIPPRPSNESAAKTVALEELAKAAGMTPREYGERFTSLKKPATPFEEWQYTQQQNAALKPRKVFDPNEMKVGDVIIPFVGDLTSAGQRVTNINQRQLAKPLLTEGGESYMRSTPDIWASGQSIISALNNRARRAIEVAKAMGNKEPTAYGFHVGMDPMAGDFSTHTAEGILGLLPSAKIKAADIKKFDQFMKTPTSEFKGLKDWPGLRSDKLYDYLMDQGKGAARIKFSKGMDKAEWRDLGFPDVGPARFASTETLLGGLPTGATGTSIGRLAAENAVSKAPESIHRSYPVSLRGEYVGGLASPLQRDLIFKDWSDRFNANPPERNFISAKNKSYANKDAYQIVTNEWLDMISRALEQSKQNKAEGGRTMGNNALDNALRTAREHYGFGGADRDAAEGSTYTSNISRETPSFRQAETQSMQSYDRAINEGWSPTGGGGGGGERATQVRLGDLPSQSSADAARQFPSVEVSPFGFGRREAIYGQDLYNAPNNIRQYTEQRLATVPENIYEAAKNPSLYYGMGYPGVVGAQPSRAGTAGLLGTLYGESSYDPAAINPESGAVGLAQYLGPRKQDFLRAMGIETTRPTDAQLTEALSGTAIPQMGYIINEMLTEPTYDPSAKQYLQGVDPSRVTDVLTRNFERPSEAEIAESFARRAAEAQSIYAGETTPTEADLAARRGAPAAAPTAMGHKGYEDLQTGFNYPKSDQIPLTFNASLTPALNRARIAELEGQGMTELGREYELTDAEGNVISPKEWYRQDMERQLGRPVSIDEVKSGIVTRDGQQVVNYALKDPETEILKALMPGAGAMAVLNKLFGNKTGDQQVADAINVARESGRDADLPAQNAIISAASQAAPPPYTTELSAGNLALPSTSGMTAEQWAAANTGGDLSKVHARIVYKNGAPQLEYYTV